MKEKCWVRRQHHKDREDRILVLIFHCCVADYCKHSTRATSLLFQTEQVHRPALLRYPRSHQQGMRHFRSPRALCLRKATLAFRRENMQFQRTGVERVFAFMCFHLFIFLSRSIVAGFFFVSSRSFFFGNSILWWPWWLLQRGSGSSSVAFDLSPLCRLALPNPSSKENCGRA